MLHILCVFMYVCIKYVCVSATLLIQHAKRMRCIVLSSVVCFVLPYSSTLPDKRHDFLKNVCFDFPHKFV
jgi:hypothetical protein